ncbi:hypothetical protein [Halohasta litorea]|uniref:Polysaccharide lyase n=1 Tax=Halohasta litorea TaxID=869891 RepID=A0ABD6DC81_9EURY|nr:hypothetical protein [Halohasta litorea]
MTGEPSRFTSDRRRRESASWVDGSDWQAGIAENVDVVEEGLVPRTPPQAGDVPATAVETFEDANVGEYNKDSNGRGSFSTTTSRYWMGSRCVEFDNASSTKVFSREGDGLNYYPQQGDVVEWYIYADFIETCSTSVVIGTNGNPSNWVQGYECEIRADGNNSDFSMALDSREGSFSRVSIGNYLDEWLRGRFEFSSDANLVYELYQTNGSDDRGDHTLINSVTYDAAGEAALGNRAFGFFSNNFGNGGRRSRAFFDEVCVSEGVV